MNGLHRAVWAGFAVLVTLWTTLSTARANPNQGEPRSITRDPDRLYTVVAGEGDGASTVTNPANLGFVDGFNAVVDASFTAPDAMRRGGGVGLLMAIPLPLRFLTLGLGYQHMLPIQPDAGDTGGGEIFDSDVPYGKLSFAAAVPLMRWVRGLSLGLGYSRLISRSNAYADGVNQVDLAVGYRVNRFVALGLVGRTLNMPRTASVNEVVQPLIIDPEFALRPLGTPALELGVGARFAPVTPSEARFRIPTATPRGRLLLTFSGFRLFTELELYRHFPEPAVTDTAEFRSAVRISSGFEILLPHFGFGAGLLAGAGGAEFPLHGGTARLRFSAERYPGFIVQPQQLTRLALARYRGDRGMWKLVQQIDQLAERRVSVLIETRGLSLGFAQLEEVREALLRLRARGGKAIAYLEGGGLKTYFLASACDRIIARPDRSLWMTGIRTNSFYLGALLEKLGVRAEFVRVAEYKGTPENWERETASTPVAEQRRMLTTDVWNHVVRVIARERGYDPLVVARWIDEAPHQPDDARRLAIVDELAYEDELDARIEAWLGRRVRIEEPSKRKPHRTAFGPMPRIAVVYVDGDLVEGDSLTIPLIGRRVAGSRTLTAAIKAAREDPGVKAVVVRIDSVGGMVSAAADIARELDLTREKKPVVISLGNVAASGGYQIATAGQYIVSDATTLTGSIGVFYPKFDLSGALDKLGIGVDSVQFGAHAGVTSLWKPYSVDERNVVLREMQATYDRFVERVSKARAMTPERVDAVARGRVWSGVRAIDVGLVDSYGGLREAIMRATAIAGLRPGTFEIEELPEVPGLLQRIRTLFGLRLPSPFGAAAPPGLETAAARSSLGLPAGLLVALRHLPVSLWMGDQPRAMALEPEILQLAE